MSAEINKKIAEGRTASGFAWVRLFHVLLAVVIITFGIGGMLLLRHLRKDPVKVERQSVAPLVDVEKVQKRDIEMLIYGYGTVQAKVESEVVPQVSGKVVEVSDNFKNGGFITAGEVLIKIDPRDYELAVQRAQAQVAQAQVALELELAEAEVSRQEWDQLNPGKEPSSQLVVRGPQIRQAKTRLAAAKAELETALLNLERTQITLPFDGRVVSEMIDPGQYVTIGEQLGKVYGIEAVEIEVPLEDWELAWFDVPNPSGNGSDVTVQAEFAGGYHKWAGRVVRTTGEVDKTSRLVNVVVEVDKPFERVNGRVALVPGMFAEVVIKGRTLKDAIAVKRYALHEGKKVWVVRGGRLFIQEVQIAREDENYAYVISGLGDGAEVVLSSLDVVADGMSVRISGSEETK